MASAFDGWVMACEARWSHVEVGPPFGTGLVPATIADLGPIYRSICTALGNLVAQKPVAVSFRRGASFADLARGRIGIDGELLETALKDPRVLEQLVAHAAHEGAHHFLTRVLELKRRERADARFLHWIHNGIEDERIEPLIARVYPPLGPALREGRAAIAPDGIDERDPVHAFLALLRAPQEVTPSVWTRHGELLAKVIDVLTPFPEESDGVEAAARAILKLFPADLRKQIREAPRGRLPGERGAISIRSWEDGDPLAPPVDLDGGLDGSHGGGGWRDEGIVDPAWPRVVWHQARAHPVGYERVRREVAMDVERLAGRLACLFPEPTRPHAQSGKIDRKRLPLWQVDDRIFLAREACPARLDLAIVIDLSGSMSGKSARVAQRLAVTIVEAAARHPGVRIFVYGHTADLDGPSTDLFRLATPAVGRVDSLGELPVRSNNRDAAAYLEILRDLEQLAGRAAQLRAAVLIGDGSPAANDFHGVDAVAATRAAIVQMERRWGPVLVLPTDRSPVLEALAPHPGALVDPDAPLDGLGRFFDRAVGGTH
jgi:hypothetical protein